MKNIFVILSVLMLVFMVACAPVAPKVDSDLPAASANDKSVEASSPVAPVSSEPAASNEPNAAQPAKEVGRTEPKRPLPSERTNTAPTESASSAEESTSVSAPASDLSPKIRDLIKRKDEKMKSVQFLYGGTETANLFLNTFLIKDEMIRINKFSEDYYVREDYYDTVYVTQSIGCCEEQARCKSRNVDNTVVKFDIDSSLVKVPKLPQEWMNEIKSNAKVIGPQTVDARSVTYLVYEDDAGNEVHMWVDDTYGVPHKVEVRSGEDLIAKYQFNDMRFNSLKDADFVAPCKDLPTA